MERSFIKSDLKQRYANCNVNGASAIALALNGIRDMYVVNGAKIGV